MGVPLGEIEEELQSTTGLPSRSSFPQSLAVAMRSSDIEDAKILSGKPAFDSESTDSSSESEEDSDDDIEGSNDNWSGANDYVEAAIFQAAFPDLELAAHLISQMYSMLLLGSSKRISRKVSSWRERITTCTTDSGTTSTEKVALSNVTSNTPRAGDPRRDRLFGSTDSNIGEEEDDDNDDNDKSRRKRLKENNLGSGLEIPTQRLACPFNKMDASKYGIQHNQEGQINDRQYRTCAGPGFRTIQLLK